MNTDPLGEPCSPALGHLIAALTTAGHPDELTGREAALTALRAARAEAKRGRPRFAALIRSARVTTAAAALVPSLAGVTAAAYAAALPEPMQHIAHRVLAPLGVPDDQVKVSVSLVARHRPQPPAPRFAAPSSPEVPRPADHGTNVALGVARSTVPAGGDVFISARLTKDGQADHGIMVRLLELPAGAPQSGWRVAGTATTGARGLAGFQVGRLATNAVFALTGPDGTRSATVRVTVVPRVVLSLVAQPGTGSRSGPAGRMDTEDRPELIAQVRPGGGPGPTGGVGAGGRPEPADGENMIILVVGSPSGDRGDVVLLAKRDADGAWHVLARSVLGADGKAVFTLPCRSASGHVFHAVLAATAAHAEGTSNPVEAPRLAALRVIGRAADDQQRPGDDDEQEPRDPRRAAADETDAEPGDEQRGTDRRPRRPGGRAAPADRALGAPVDGRSAGAQRTRRSRADAGGRQPVQVDGGQVGEQRVQVADRLRGERPVDALVELLWGQPALRVVLAQQRRRTFPVRV